MWFSHKTYSLVLDKGGGVALCKLRVGGSTLDRVSDGGKITARALTGAGRGFLKGWNASEAERASASNAALFFLTIFNCLHASSCTDSWLTPRHNYVAPTPSRTSSSLKVGSDISQSLLCGIAAHTRPEFGVTLDVLTSCLRTLLDLTDHKDRACVRLANHGQLLEQGKVETRKTPGRVQFTHQVQCCDWCGCPAFILAGQRIAVPPSDVQGISAVPPSNVQGTKRLRRIRVNAPP